MASGEYAKITASGERTTSSGARESVTPTISPAIPASGIDAVPISQSKTYTVSVTDFIGFTVSVQRTVGKGLVPFEAAVLSDGTLGLGFGMVPTKHAAQFDMPIEAPMHQYFSGTHDANTLPFGWTYIGTGYGSHLPDTTHSWYVLTQGLTGRNNMKQFAFMSAGTTIKQRNYTGGAWTSWSTVVS